MSNYAIVENESVCRNLEDIASWLREKDDDISPEIRKRLNELAKKVESCSSELEEIVADHYKGKETELILEKIAKEGFKPIPTRKRVKMLEEQRKRIEESEKCFKTDRKQLERQFTL